MENGPDMGHSGGFGPQQGPRAVSVPANTAGSELAGVAAGLRGEAGEEGGGACNVLGGF